MIICIGDGSYVFKVSSQRAKVKEKAKIFFDVCRLSFVKFLVFFSNLFLDVNRPLEGK